MDEVEVKKIQISEFRKLGYLQELNRQFLHPLGLALEVSINEDGTESLGGVWDYRDDPEGIMYAYSNSKLSPPDRVATAMKRAQFVCDQQSSRRPAREKALGFWVEPLGEILK